MTKNFGAGDWESNRKGVGPDLLIFNFTSCKKGPAGEIQSGLMSRPPGSRLHPKLP